MQQTTKKRFVLLLLLLLATGLGIYTLYNKSYPPSKNIVILSEIPSMGLFPIHLDEQTTKHNVYFITTKNFVGSAKNLIQSKGYIEVDDIKDVAQVKQAVEKLVKKYALKRIDRLVDYGGEELVRLGAEIRKDFNIPGMKPAQARCYVNKRTMKEKLAARAAPIIPYTNDIINAPQKLKTYKLVLKPICSSGSKGIWMTKDQESFQQSIQYIKQDPNRAMEDYIAEPYIEGDTFKIDGLVQKGRIVFFVCHKMIGNCYDFYRNNKRRANIMVTDPTITKKLKQLAKHCMAMGHANGAFQIEVMQNRDTKEYLIMEVAARCTGSNFPLALKNASGFDFYKAAIAIACGDSITIPHEKINANVVGIVTIPVQSPAKEVYAIHITDIPTNDFGLKYESFRGYMPFDTCRWAWMEELPRKKQLFFSNTLYISFLLVNDSAQKVHKDAQAIIDDFTLQVASY